MAVLPMRLKAFLAGGSAGMPGTLIGGILDAFPCPPLRRKASKVNIVLRNVVPRSSETGLMGVGEPKSVGVPRVLGSSSSLHSSASLKASSCWDAQTPSTFENSRAAIRETSRPPCPSNTANNAWVARGGGSSSSTQTASSIAGRQPCISAVAHSRNSSRPAVLFFCRFGPPLLSDSRNCVILPMASSTVNVMTPFRVVS
mmetsp:Transcript_60062/g.127219  ORF Transcript_60062/g.127219 Transcript_60062/m.127219 type:complete len:200 (+) Transcript_60062:765-1364(+)